jgi:hypothetical protein
MALPPPEGVQDASVANTAFTALKAASWIPSNGVVFMVRWVLE